MEISLDATLSRGSSLRIERFVFVCLRPLETKSRRAQAANRMDKSRKPETDIRVANQIIGVTHAMIRLILRAYVL